MKTKKILAAILTATMVMGAGTTAFAGSGSAAPAQSASSESKSSDAEETTVSEVIPSVKTAGTSMTVAGKSVKTTIAGSYAAKSVQGLAVTGTMDSIKKSLGIKAGQTPYIMIFDTNAKKSYLAMNCVNAAAQAIGGQVEATLTIDLGVRSNGQYVRLSKGTVGMVVGRPKGVDTTKTVSIVCVRPGGIIDIVDDEDDNPNTVTFEVNAGLGTYAIVTK